MSEVSKMIVMNQLPLQQKAVKVQYGIILHNAQMSSLKPFVIIVRSLKIAQAAQHLT